MSGPTQPSAHGVRIDAQPGSVAIAIDGISLDVGQITGYQIEHSVADSLPMLILHTRQADGLAFEGLTRVAVATQHDPGQAIADFVLSLDSAALQQAALDRPDLSGSRTETTEAILKQIADWARGRR